MNATQIPSTQTSLDDSEVTAAEGRGSEGTQVAIGQAAEVIVIDKPAPGQTVEIQAAPNQTYVLAFPADQAGVELRGEDLVFTFDENGDGSPESQIVFLDLVAVAEAGDGPAFQVGEITVGAETLVDQAVALAGLDDASLEQVAAGPELTGGGTSVYSDDVGSPIDLLNGSPVIGETNLQFGTLDLENDDPIVTFAGDGGPDDPAGDRMNLMLMLDTSGSMKDITKFDNEQISRIEALDRTTEHLLDDYAQSGLGQLRVHMVSFAEGVKEEATFDIVIDGTVDPAALQAAKDFILAPGEDPQDVGRDFTNYEAGFGAAYAWFNDDSNTLDNPDFNHTILISDGKPNRGYAGDGEAILVDPGSAQGAVDHVLGTANEPGQAPDTISEFDLLTGSFKGTENTVDTFGLNTSAAALDILGQVDSDGSSTNLHNSDEVVISPPPPSATSFFEGAGEDTLASSLTS